MNRVSQIDTEAQKAIIANRGKMSLRAYAVSIKENAGYLSAVLRGQRPASNRLRVKLGLHPHTVSVAPLPCGHAPSGKRCAVCQPATKKPRRKYDLSYAEIRRRIEAAPWSPEVKRELCALLGV